MDKPLIFSAPMILALLAGRKSQTRRIIKLPPGGTGTVKMRLLPSDRLWVKETWCQVDDREFGDRLWIDYRATPRFSAEHPAGWESEPDNPDALKWRSSRYMPRWASRLTLEVRGVKVERVQEISDEDAIAEGIDLEKHKCGCEVCSRTSQLCPATASSVIMEFAELWNSIHGPGAWEANSWVYAISFKTHKCNIDAMPGPFEVASESPIRSANDDVSQKEHSK